MVFIKIEEVIFMEDRLRRWLVPAIAAALVLTGIVVVASAMRFNGLNSAVASVQEKEKLQSERREKLEREIKELTEGLQKETNPEVREKLSRMLRERKEQLEGGEVYYFIRENRGAGLEAAKWAKISMDQAVQIATSQYPGTALQCNLIGEREDKVFYHVMILSGEEGNSMITHVMVNAIDGSVVKTEKELPRKQRSPE
jgi:uncharacterized membrane protein YkoI